MSKGSVARPFDIDQETFAQRWEATFGPKPEKDEPKPNQDKEVEDGE